MSPPRSGPPAASKEPSSLYFNWSEFSWVSPISPQGFGTPRAEERCSKAGACPKTAPLMNRSLWFYLEGLPLGYQPAWGPSSAEGWQLCEGQSQNFKALHSLLPAVKDGPALEISHCQVLVAADAPGERLHGGRSGAKRE